MIKFGTDGWRAIMAEDFTFANVEKVAQAIADHIRERGPHGKPVVVGYDARFLSEKFAKAVAEVLVGNGIEVILPKEDAPTPVVAVLIRVMDAAGAVMITASHNPPEYNGIKFIPHYAGPALPDITSHIESLIGKNAVAKEKFDEALHRGKIKVIDPYPHYRSWLERALGGKPVLSGIKVVADPLYGSAREYLPRLIEEFGAEVFAIHTERDVLFGDLEPNPRDPEMLKDLAGEVKRKGADIGLATDGDADRFGIIEKDGTYVIPNEFLAVVVWYLYEIKKLKGPVARTVATTHLIDRIAEHHGFKAVETPVGFKYMGEELRKGAIFGGEESGGMSIAGHVPEKDGIIADILAAMIVKDTGMSVKEVLEKKVFAITGPLYSDMKPVRFSSEEEKNKAWEDFPKDLKEVAGVKVEKRSTIDGVKYYLRDGSWLLVRKSGTEPVIRIYAEAPERERVCELIGEGERLLGAR